MFFYINSKFKLTDNELDICGSFLLLLLSLLIIDKFWLETGKWGQLEIFLFNEGGVKGCCT